MKHPLPLLAVVLLINSCNTHPATHIGRDSGSRQSMSVARQQTATDADSATISPALLEKYRQACLRDTSSYDKRFGSNFIRLINTFKDRKLDTTILTVDNIDGDSVPDTITTRAYYHAHKIIVDSRWIKSNTVLWRDRFTDPYTELNDDLFNPAASDPWVTFGIGVFYGPPDFYPFSVFDSGGIWSVYNQGIEDLNSAGIHTTKDEYKAYLDNFKGHLLTCGQPESRERLWIWYKPAARMITYYQP